MMYFPLDAHLMQVAFSKEAQHDTARRVSQGITLGRPGTAYGSTVFPLVTQPATSTIDCGISGPQNPCSAYEAYACFADEFLKGSTWDVQFPQPGSAKARR